MSLCPHGSHMIHQLHWIISIPSCCAGRTTFQYAETEPDMSGWAEGVSERNCAGDVRNFCVVASVQRYTLLLNQCVVHKGTFDGIIRNTNWPVWTFLRNWFSSPPALPKSKTFSVRSHMFHCSCTNLVSISAAVRYLNFLAPFGVHVKDSVRVFMFVCACVCYPPL